MENFFSPSAAKLCLSLALLFGLTSCASISVRSGREGAARLPIKIYVATFATKHGEFNVDREDQELAVFETNLQHVLQVAQVADLSNRLIAAAPAPAHPETLHRSAWLICGQFVKVNQGSRFLRAAIGFGAGGTKLETRGCRLRSFSTRSASLPHFFHHGGQQRGTGRRHFLRYRSAGSRGADCPQRRLRFLTRVDRGYQAHRARDHGQAFRLHVPPPLGAGGRMDSAQGVQPLILSRAFHRPCSWAERRACAIMKNVPQFGVLNHASGFQVSFFNGKSRSQTSTVPSPTWAVAMYPPSARIFSFTSSTAFPGQPRCAA